MIKKYKIDFAADCSKHSLDRVKNLQVPCAYLTEDHLKMWLRGPSLDFTQVCGIDIETYSIPEYEGTHGAGLAAPKSLVRTIQIYDGKEVVVLDFMMPDGSNLLATDKTVLGHVTTLLKNGKFTAHNAQFEVNHFTKMLEMVGSPSELIVHCTMNAYRLIRQATTHEWMDYAAGLKEVSQAVLGVTVDKDIQHNRWKTPGPLDEEQLKYCARDAVLPVLLLEVLWPNLHDFGMTDFYQLQTEVYNVLAHMHLFGAPIDVEAHDKVIAEWEMHLRAAEHKCFELLNKDRVFTCAETCWQVVSEKIATKQLKLIGQEMLDFMSKVSYGDLTAIKELMEFFFSKAEEHKEERALRVAYSRAAKNLEAHLINPGSDKQLSNWVKAHVDKEVLNEWPLTDSSKKYVEKCMDDGKPIDPELVQLQMTNEAVEDFGDPEVMQPILDYKKYSKLHGTYGVGLKKFYTKTPWSKGETTIHGEYSTCFTETGRLSTYKPTVQNAPRLKEFRKIYTTRGPGYKFLSADFSQIELRTQAEITQDPVMLDIYANGGDIHDTTAEGILKFNGQARSTVDEDFWKRTRDASKNVNFACQYGGGAAAVKKGGRKSKIKLPLETWRTFVDAYRQTYHVAYQYQLDNSAACKETLKITIPYGKVASLHPDYAYTQSSNFPIQGAAAVALLISLRDLYRCYYMLPELDFRITKTVHDSIDLDVREDQVDVIRAVLETCMTNGYKQVFPNATTLHNLIGVKIGDNWGDCD